jgi:Meiotically up-regulated gene 113
MKKYWNRISILKDPSNLYKGLGWVQVTTEDLQAYPIPKALPTAYEELRRDFEERMKLPNWGNEPSRGRAGTKKFYIDMDGHLVEIRAQKSMTNQAVFAWVLTWAPTAKLITPGGKSLSADSRVSKSVSFVYFIYNQDSNAIKIGWARNVQTRLAELQTASPIKLKLLKTIQLETPTEAQSLEKQLHRHFAQLRIQGEWFQADPALHEFVMNNEKHPN